MNSKQELQAYEAGQRTAARHALEVADRYLAGCDDIIVDIARAITRPPLAPSASRTLQALYGDALDMRSQAYERRANSSPTSNAVTDMAFAMETVWLATRAYEVLVDVEHALYPERRRRTPPPL